ncbi:unnamed protein product (mitochondrion) [Plasmodiophora brassicae]|uniref:Uncharacterized protein n=1 Tax=Plasmodiophora brassicae TaxID=37360 RepID=A0A3P3YB51_PLABS|nr:unnamed protein product [Plasmodiophora brassicae]
MTIFDDSTELSRALCDEFEKHAVRGLEKLSCLEKGLLGHGRRRRPSYKVNAGPQHLSFRGRTVDAFNHTFTPRQACLVAHYSPKGSVPGRFTWNTDASDVADIRRQAPDIPEFHSDSVLVRQKDAYRLMIVMIGMLRADGVYFARVSPDSDAVDVYIMRDERLERVKLHDDSALLQYTDRSYRQLTAKFAVNAREVMLRYVNGIASLTKATETDDDGNVVKLVITDASDASITYEYDARGRLVNTIFKDVQCDDSLSDDEYDDEDSDDDDSDDDVWSLEDQDRADDIPEEDDSDVPVLEALPAPRAPVAPEVAPDMAAQPSPLGTLEQQLAAAAPLYPSYDSPLDPMPPGIIVPTASDLADNGMLATLLPRRTPDALLPTTKPGVQLHKTTSLLHRISRRRRLPCQLTQDILCERSQVTMALWRVEMMIVASHRPFRNPSRARF